MVNKAKTMRTANVRISAVNNTKENGIVKYSLEDIQNILKRWEAEKNFEYFLIEHKEDMTNIHFHIVLKFASNATFQVIKNKFPYGDIQPSRSIKNSIQYLVHMNNPEKYQYSWEEVLTNSKDLKKYMLRSKVSEELDIKDYIDAIGKGIIKEYEYTEKIPIEIYSKYSSRIDRAFKFYYDKISLNADRKVEVEFIYGESGLGKTLLAKTLAELVHKSYCISSSSNDPLQDYRGQEVLILDDLRDDVFKFDDLLKILDNDTRSSINSRYRNKHFIGKTIIITSTVKLEDWYSWKEYEDKTQLKRRIGSKIEVGKENIKFYEYNRDIRDYKSVGEIINICKISSDILKEEKKKKKGIKEKYKYLFDNF